MDEKCLTIDEEEIRAAEALCELSSSPTSLLFPTSSPSKPVSSPGSSVGSSGCHDMSSGSHTAVDCSSVDEGIDLDIGRRGFIRQMKTTSLTEIFQCTWPGCDWCCESSISIERHIRQEHQCGSDSEEEMFYYTSKKVPVDDACGITQAFTNLQASSPPQRHFTASDHDYLVKAQRSSAPQPIPIPRRAVGGGSSSAHHSFQLSHSPLSPTSSVSPQSRSWHYTSHMNGAAPSASPGHSKRSRGDVKKCRKVYGVERRDEWCTQCKWKKACARFVD